MKLSILAPKILIIAFLFILLNVPTFIFAENREYLIEENEATANSVRGTISPDIFPEPDHSETSLEQHTDADTDTGADTDIDAISERDETIYIENVKAETSNEDDLNIERVTPFESAPKLSGSDEVDEEEDVIAPAQDYNSTRSNRRKNVFGGRDDDVDSDNWPEAIRRAGDFVFINGESPIKGIDESIFCWGRAEDLDGRVYSWGRGLCVASAGIEGSSSTRISALQVVGSDVRAWSADEKLAWREYQNISENNDHKETIAAHIIEQALSDNRIKEIRVDNESVEIQYQADLRLFGFLRIRRNLTASVDLEKKVKIDYPWYGFLARKPQSENIRSLLLDTMAILVLVPGRSN